MRRAAVLAALVGPFLMATVPFVAYALAGRAEAPEAVVVLTTEPPPSASAAMVPQPASTELDPLGLECPGRF